LWMYQRTMNGPTSESVAAMPDLRPRELLAVVPLVALIVAMGIYPKPVLDRITPSVNRLVARVEVSTHTRQPAVARLGPAGATATAQRLGRP
ncbi:MAG: hypothetical protein ACRDY3_12100, partial [Acidimicrobiales bacterium]